MAVQGLYWPRQAGDFIMGGLTGKLRAFSESVPGAATHPEEKP